MIYKRAVRLHSLVAIHGQDLQMNIQLEARIVELETRLAFQEQASHELNNQVVHQRAQIEALVRDIQALKDRLRAAAPSPVGPLEDEKPPPHY